MAKKKKSDELAELRDRLRSQTDLYMDAEPLLPIARALQEAIDARLLGDSGSAVDVDRAWDDALHEVAQRIIRERLDTMDPELVLRLYAEQVGDDELKATLGEWATRRARELELAHRREDVRTEAARSGSVALAGLEPGARLRVALFDPAQRSQARKDGSVPPQRTMEFRLVVPERGEVELVSDAVLAFTPQETLPPHCRGSIGAAITAVDGTCTLEPRLQLHAPLGYDFGGGPQNTPQIIGFAEIDEGALLLQ